MKYNKTQVIAFYLPQFYPTPENDEWWEPGFTEWTNVVRAKPLFKGHVQPRIPRDLGFYDLRVPETRERQAELAREAGIGGFCYWHYWFAGRRLLDRVFREVVESGKPDFPFCLCWANHSWYKKTWDPTKPDTLLIEQTYPGEQDFINHFNAMLPAFRDKRYMRADDRLLFGIFDTHSFKTFRQMRDLWNRMAKDNGLPGFYFFGLVQLKERLATTEEQQYDAVVYEHLPTLYFSRLSLFNRTVRHLLHRPIVIDYPYYMENTVAFFKKHPSLTPCIVPNFDHSPRSGYKGIMMRGSTPERWYDLCTQIKGIINEGSERERILFIKSWNEWAEGNYLEPDSEYGKRYIEMTRKSLEEQNAKS